MKKFNFEETIKKLQEQKYDLPVKISITAQSYFADTFRKGGFDGEKWKEVKRRLRPSPSSDKSASTRGILIGKTRDLMDSIRHSIREVSWAEIRLGTDVPYAIYHNEGTDKIPKREFMGSSKELDDKIDKVIKKAMDKIFDL